MKNSKTFSLAKPFSHIYVEKEVISHHITQEILKKFTHSKVIPINHYKEVFSRPRQSYKLQELSKKLILAKRRDTFLSPASPLCQNFGYHHFYYTNLIINCIFNCDYCFLKGMYSSANIVIFVNIEDYFQEIENMLKKHPLYLSISYETDLLAMEGIAPFFSQFVNLAYSKEDLILEVRTKSVNYMALKSLKPSPNVILAWTLLPQEIIERFEPQTPRLPIRINTIKKAICDGWRVRLSFDPIIFVEDWREIYERFIDYVFREIPSSQIQDISVGVFRIPKEYLKKMRKTFENEITLFPYIEDKEAYTYPSPIKEELLNFIISKIKNYIPENKIFTI